MNTLCQIRLLALSHLPEASWYVCGYLGYYVGSIVTLMLDPGYPQTSRFVCRGQILYGKRIELNLSGNEVDYTNSFTLLVRNMLCSKLLFQKGFDLILFSY